VRYYLRRISLSRVARLGCALGWLAALPPAVGLAGGILFILQRMQQALQQVEPLTVSLLGQEVLRIDWLDVLRLQPLADRLALWTDNLVLTFIVLSLGFTLLGSVLLLLIGLLVCGAYNLLSQAGWGLAVELVEDPAVQARS